MTENKNTVRSQDDGSCLTGVLGNSYVRELHRNGMMRETNALYGTRVKETALNLKMAASWVVATYSPVEIQRRFRGTYRLC